MDKKLYAPLLILGVLALAVGCQVRAYQHPLVSSPIVRATWHHRRPWGGDVVFLPPVKDLAKLDQNRGDLEQQLRSGEARQRHQAASKLGWLLDPRALAALKRVLDDADPEVRAAARSSRENLLKYFQFMALRPPASVLTRSEPVHMRGGDAIQGESNNELKGLLFVWGGHDAWWGQGYMITDVAGLAVDHRLPAGNLVYLLSEPGAVRHTAVYYTPTCQLYRTWRLTDDGMVLGDDRVVEAINMENIVARSDPVTYRLMTRGYVLVARRSGETSVEAIGEQFKDQSSGAFSVRDWLLRTDTGNQTTYSAFCPEINALFGSLASFVAIHPESKAQALGTVQITEEGVRVLARVTASCPDLTVRREELTQMVPIPRPVRLAVTDTEQQCQRLPVSKNLPHPSGAGFETKEPPDLQTRALVRENDGGVWLLVPEEKDDQIVVEAVLKLPQKKLDVHVIFAEGSELRFDPHKWVHLEPVAYSGGGVQLYRAGNQFLEGTRRSDGLDVTVFSGGEWLPSAGQGG